MKLPFNDKKFIFLLLAVFVAVSLEILSVSGIDIPSPYALFIYGIIILGTGCKVFWNGLQSLFRLRFGSISLLMMIAAVAAFYLGEYPEATVVIVLYMLGEKLEDVGIENSLSALDKLVSEAPQTALVKGRAEPVRVEEIPVGTLIQVKPHDKIPLDGVVTEGETIVDESSITGEPIPKEKTAGSTVFAGTLNMHGFIELRTVKTAKDTTFARIIELTAQAQNNKSDAQKFIQKFAAIYTPVIILLASLLFVVPVFILGKELNVWLNQAISLLVISCPCALVISTPVAVYAAIGNASGKGLLVKGGKYIEAMAGVKAIGLDKTRTITYGKPVVSDIVPLNGSTKEELLACCAGTELFSEHPLAQAIVDCSTEAGFEPHRIRQFESLTGKGAKAHCMTCGGNAVFVGKWDSIAGENPGMKQETETLINRFSAEGKTCVILSCGRQIKGLIALTDEVKPESAEAIQAMRALGVTPVMITGDSRQAAQYVASRTGIEQVFAELLPEGKTEIVKKLQSEYRKAAMVGDGVNDAPALAAANVSIAMAATGSDTAIEVSDIALMNDKLSLIPYLIRLSRKTVTTVKRNTVGAIGVKILFILLAFLGYGNLVMAIAADVGVMLAVVLISLRIMAFR
ncbi:MAG: cation-translocating P-type ATPase [Dysgonamonadaceae bacterium]|jgi:Cd2+/Zn2+-exporting ATPase|nr:cation-translocating P-type ATPase [Dysgonamonadaceae bacterium]